MPALTYEIGARNTGLKAAVSDSKRAIKDLSDYARRQNSAAVSAAGGTRNIGMAALQAQDIAVQLQYGASATTIIAQQGSQLASIFGPGGMILGGVLAIGGALATWGLNAKEAFETAREEFKNFNQEVVTTMAFGGAGELDAIMGKSRQSMVELRKANAEALGFFKVMGAAIGQMFGGESAMTQQKAIANQMHTQLTLQNAMGERRVEIEEGLLKVQQMRAAGQKEAADELEREVKLQEQILKAAQIYRGENFERLRIVLQQRSALEEQTKEQERQKKIEEECTEEAEKHADAIAKQKEEVKNLTEALIEAQRRITAMRDDRIQAEQKLSQVGEDGQTKQNRLLNEYAALQGALHAAQMQQLPEAERIREAIANKQIELAENAVQLNKDNLSEEEKRKKNMEALGTAIKAAQLALENQKTENIQKAVEDRLKTPDQRRAEGKAKRDKEKAIRQQEGLEIDQADAKRRNKGWDLMTKEEKDAMRANIRKEFDGKQDQQMAQSLQNIEKSVASLADKVSVAKK